MGDYEGEKTFSFDIKLGVRKVESLDNTANGIKVSWKKYKAASGYVVYRGVNGKAYTIAGVVQNPEATSFVDVKAKMVGVKYTYKIVKIYKQKKQGYVTIYRDPDKTTLALITCTKGDKKSQPVYIAERI